MASATIHGKKVGTWGHAASFSFYPGKNLGAYGDAGGMATNDSNLAAKARMIANHGQPEKHTHLLEGRNSRLDGMQGAILSVKLRHLDTWTAQRQAHASAYDTGLVHSGLRLPIRPEGRTSVHHLYVVENNHRDRLREELNSKGIQTAIHYPHALPTMQCYSEWNAGAKELFPVATAMSTRILSLPMFPELAEEERNHVIQSLKG